MNRRAIHNTWLLSHVLDLGSQSLFSKGTTKARASARVVKHFQPGTLQHLMLPIRKRKFSQARFTPKQGPLLPSGGFVSKRRRYSAPARQPIARGFTRTGGFYGRYGNVARELGVVPEKKFLDVPLSFTYDTTCETASSAATGQLDLIPQGDTESTRDGRQCTILSVNIRGALTFTPGASATASGCCVMYLILDTQANGAQAAWTDIFVSTALNLTVNNMANSGRFRTLKKWFFTWNPPAGATTAFNTQTKWIEFFKKVVIPMEFSSTTGAIGEIKSNHLFLAYGSFGTALDDTVAFSGVSRIRFRG